MVLHQFDYLFAIGTIFAFLDAWNIGANDVANSWATSVSSRSLKYWQAMVLASIMEFGGSIGVGARVADTIRTKIVDVKQFSDNPALLMLGMVCAITASSIYLTVATRLGLPVSTTHSIMGGVIGMGIAALGADGIKWWGGDINSGVVQIFLAWIIAPALRITLNDAETAGVIVGVGAAVALVIAAFFLPWLHRKVIKGDWELQWWHVFQGPLVLRRGEVPPAPAGHQNIQNFYEGHKTLEELERERADPHRATPSDEESEAGKRGAEKENGVLAASTEVNEQKSTLIGPRPEGAALHPAVLFWQFRRFFFRGIEQDVVSLQKKRNILTGDLEMVHAHARHYDNKAEYMYSFLQIMTAATASFTHGANDVSNAVGPYATIYYVWSTNDLKSKSPVPYWILAFGGAAIVIGLWTYGYNIMRNLGNRITLHSPSRGFSMELGSAITIIMATRLKLPISTTQCISGATVGVGLCNGTWRTINWRMIAWICFGWFITLPVTGIISGCLMGIIINAPRWGLTY
ncbi:inorganic phosphate transporter [Aspergillus clavatus NRRL 1]|uniref:Phosphate transporter n=1 Tax=Aspergillus clavatus (strain ATCC 1007 / CBS 513.65 / DSM 816 / NCTC 3887 / NRRL 1 / QM 1276 / 107) TaxID=344612 RepID=A1CCD0_ASPCL|nr:phosphate-repressible Na+/phosphate cotransporter Pho89, putative [Aspergillus clavatus NRRL 1]EAW12187.1 phosphate-repressible Na+/phosphate cotransporter Pho89, putative [Aspergillus clavatus NRRL 1]